MPNEVSDVELALRSSDKWLKEKKVEDVGANGTETTDTTQQSSPAHLEFLHAFRTSWPGGLPQLSITYTNLSFTAQIPVNTNKVETIWSAARKQAEGLLHTVKRMGNAVGYAQPPSTVEFRGLHSVSGVLRPGEMTLILAPPGHGKSMLLKGLAGRLHETEFDQLGGEVRWNGRTYNELANLESGGAGALQVRKLCAYVDQGDIHYPMLTVRETFQFAAKQANIDLTGHATLSSFDENRVELIIQLLGLTRCADTIVGNAVVRGVSGGERRRVSLGEMLLTNARALFLDEITTGLDAAAAIDIIRAIHTWVRITQGSAMFALLQPSKEIFELFDSVILLREGSCIYHGPRDAVTKYFSGLGIHADSNQSQADWLQEFLMAPAEMWQKDQNKKKQKQVVPISSDQQKATQRKEIVQSPDSDNPSIVRFHVDDEKLDETAARDQQPGSQEAKSLKQPPLTTYALRSTFVQSPTFSTLMTAKAEIEQRDYTSVEKQGSVSELTQRQYHMSYSRSWWTRTRICFDRQVKVYQRLPEFVVPRIAQAIVLGLIGGSVYYQLGTGAGDVDPRIAVSTFSLILMAFCNTAELPFASLFKMTVLKHIEAGFYSPGNYYASVLAMHVPLAVAEVTLFGSLLYWMGSFSPDAGRYFFFLLVMFFQNQLMSSAFRSFAYATSNSDIALHLSSPFIALTLLFGGFLITADHIPDWLIWFHHLSPFAWGLRSELLSEFGDARYDQLVTNAAGDIMRQGDLNLAIFGVKRDHAYRWAGVGYMAGLFILVSLLATWALARSHQWLTTGTRRFLETEEQQAQEISNENASNEVRVKVKPARFQSFDSSPSSSLSALPFTPASLSWNNIGYIIPVPDASDKEKALLTDVSGYARSGELTALMGSSGAGKTTLMDVLAGRKRTGTVSGNIRVNGHPQTFPAFARFSAYCQQDDIHLGTDTVREAVLFSANLRLDSSVSKEVKEQFVDEILEDLELTQLANTLIGDENSISLSPGELKRVSIGVELASNPSILFLDEPTSSLDSRAALVLVKVIRKIARRGRAVICTIHQPSQAMLSMFDRLLLLKSGGQQVYLGPVEAGTAVVNYFENVEVPAECSRLPYTVDQNPATWMLEVIGAGTGPKSNIADYSSAFKSSPAHQTMTAELELLNQMQGEPAKFTNPFAQSFGTQFIEVLKRLNRMYQRDIATTAFRLVISVLMGIVIGISYGDVNSDDESGMISKLSSMFSVIGFFAYVTCSSSLPSVYKMRHPLARERNSRMYFSPAFSLAMAVVELPWTVLSSILYGVPVYFLLGMHHDAGLFFRFLLVVFAIAVFSVAFGQLLGSFAPNIQVANIMQSTLYTFFFMFGGVFTLKNKLPIGWIFMYYISPLSKGFCAIVVQQFYCAIGDPSCPTVVSESFGDGGVMTKWQFAQSFSATGHEWDWYYIGYIGLSIVIVQILTTWAVHKQPH